MIHKYKDRIFNNYLNVFLDILPPQPQELEAMNITDKSFTLKWKAIKGKGSADATTLYQVLVSYLYILSMKDTHFGLGI